MIAIQSAPVRLQTKTSNYKPTKNKLPRIRTDRRGSEILGYPCESVKIRGQGFYALTVDPIFSPSTTRRMFP